MAVKTMWSKDTLYMFFRVGITSHRGLVMGADFVCGDNDGLGRQIFDWVRAKPFRQPIKFGDLILRQSIS